MTAVATAADRWFPLPPHPRAAVRAYAFPHAGAGALAYASWHALLPERIACVPARLPGRETRLGEPPLRHIEPLVERLVEALLPVLQPPYALLGHSMGAIVAFAVARALRGLDVEPPLGLVVSGRPAPDFVSPDISIHTLSDERLALELQRLGGLPEIVAANPELLAFFMPLLRADLEVNEAYHHREDAPLDVPVMALAGADDPRVRPQDVAGWGAHTSAGFRFETLAGGHFFPFEDPAPFLGQVVRQLDEWALDEP